MDNAIPNNPTSGLTPSLAPPTTATVPRKPYFLRLFTGRLNRAGTFLGVFVSAVALSFLNFFIILLLSRFVDGKAAGAYMPFLLIGLIIGITFFSASLSIRRLHDLNKSGYLYLIFLPSFILLLLATLYGMSGAPTSFYNIINMISNSGLNAIYRIISEFFGLYLAFWPGTKGSNKYGAPSTHQTIKEIFCFVEPPLVRTTTKNQTEKKFVKLSIKLIIGGIIFVVGLVVIAFAYSFIRGFFGLKSARIWI